MFARSKPNGDVKSGYEPADRGPLPAPTPSPAPRSAAPAAPPAARPGVQALAIKPSIISDAVTFVGELSSRGALHIDGSATGTVDAESITVGVGGRLEGTARCSTLHVKGSFSGTAICDELIIAEEAHVEGSLTYKTILAQRGAHVTGELTVATSE